MSHFARLIAVLNAHVIATGERIVLGIDTPIKCVKIVEGGVFRFQAQVFIGNGRDQVWLIVETDEDLPAFTDKGRAHRARQVHATLQPGRPLTGEEHVVKPVALRVSSSQRQWVARRAARRKLTVSDYLRRLLEADGMPS